ncbi:hypothetical protein TCON_0399 [Astathelohania contejeani]|uniref:Uncharacterized protein n=1 Tax=Astathelohania contejeani TaxID=164912 RepID=A0ABQ7I209_9MICR|nr:hypothetical protein TCON_0399 [Thelohania contejeani]
MIDFAAAMVEILNNPTRENIINLFEVHGFIRLNMVYISPITLAHLYELLKTLGYIEWDFRDNGITFIFEDVELYFKGTYNIYSSTNKIFCLEVEFEPIVSGNDGYIILGIVERYLKGCDAIFFMSYSVNIDFEVLSNPLTDSIGFLYKKIEDRNNTNLDK